VVAKRSGDPAEMQGAHNTSLGELYRVRGGIGLKETIKEFGAAPDAAGSRSGGEQPTLGGQTPGQTATMLGV
jgi:hypothetical protein